MFTRIRHAAAVLRSRPAPEPDEWVAPEVDEHKRSADDFGQLPEPPAESNLGVALLEVIFSFVVSVFVVAPIFHNLVHSISGKEVSWVGSGAAVVSYLVIDKIGQRISLKGKLKFLNPYFGKRLTRAVQIWKS
jgi:hypothetical protein